MAIPMLVAAQEETERRTYHSAEIHQAIIDAADDMLVARMSGETVELCWNLLQRLVRWSGPTQLSGGSRMGRAYRDFSQLYVQNGYLMEVGTAAVDLGRARLGLAAPAGCRTFLGRELPIDPTKKGNI